MITVTFNEATLSLASDSDADEWEADEISLVNGSEVGYVTQLNDIQSLLVLNIFTMGVLAGVMIGVILWRKL